MRAGIYVKSELFHGWRNSWRSLDQTAILQMVAVGSISGWMLKVSITVIHYAAFGTCSFAE